jgi:PII-like signaling protein
MMVIAVGASERIAAVLPEVGALLAKPLVTLERVQVVKRDGELLSAPRAPAEPGVWQKLMIYGSEQAKVDGVPMHLALVRALRETGAAARPRCAACGASTAPTRRTATACSRSAATCRS